MLKGHVRSVRALQKSKKRRRKISPWAIRCLCLIKIPTASEGQFANLTPIKPMANSISRWDDDVVFRNQARGTENRGKKEFVNVSD